jgi:hypothetical protein
LKLAQKKIAPSGSALAHAEAETGSGADAGSSSSSRETGALPGTTGKRCDHHPFFLRRAR